jgi:hypothetical protein
MEKGETNDATKKVLLSGVWWRNRAGKAEWIGDEHLPVHEPQMRQAMGVGC